MRAGLKLFYDYLQLRIGFRNAEKAKKMAVMNGQRRTDYKSDEHPQTRCKSIGAATTRRKEGSGSAQLSSDSIVAKSHCAYSVLAVGSFGFRFVSKLKWRAKASQTNGEHVHADAATESHQNSNRLGGEHLNGVYARRVGGLRFDSYFDFDWQCDARREGMAADEGLVFIAVSPQVQARHQFENKTDASLHVDGI